MANIGEKLTIPETGWRRFEDTNSNITYEGYWTIYTDRTYASNSDLHDGGEGAICRFNFIGNKIRIIGSMTQYLSTNVSISIDGEEQYFSCYKWKGGDQLLIFEITELTYTQHFVEIKNNTSKMFRFDAIDIDENGELLPYNIPFFLIQNLNNNLFSINNDLIVDLGQVSITEEIFKSNGTNKIPILTEEILNQIGSCKLLKWTDSGEVEQTVNMQGDYKDKLFKLIDGCKILTWTDNTSITKNELTYSHQPIRLLDNIENYTLKMWTDNMNITKPKLIYKCEEYRPIDKLNNNFNILEYKE